MSIRELLIENVNADLCADCPRRGVLERMLAKAVLGSGHVAEECDPGQIVNDGNLRNQLYENRLVPKPYGVRFSPDHKEALRNGSPTDMPSYPYSRNRGPTIEIGASDAVCPKDVPSGYIG